MTVYTNAYSNTPLPDPSTGVVPDPVLEPEPVRRLTDYEQEQLDLLLAKQAGTDG